MEPAVVFLANVSNFVQWIESTQDGGASSGIYEEWDLAACFTLQNQTLQLTGDHFALFVRRNHDTVFGSQSTNGRTRFDGVMTLIRCEHCQISGQSTWAMFFVAWEHFMASGQEGIQVGDGTSGSQDGVTAAVSDDLAHLRQNNVLHQDEDRGDFIREHVGVGGCSQPFTSHRHDIQTVRELIEEMGMTWMQKEICLN